MASPVKYAATGCIVEIMQSNRPLLAWVLEEQSGQLRLLTINKREMKMQSARLLPWLGPLYSGAASRQEIQERLEQHRKLREDYAAELDMEQIWELAQGEIRQADARWFAELAWPQPDADRIAAMGQALLAQKTLFRFSPPFFEVYSAEQVEQRRLKQDEDDKLMSLVTVGSEIVRLLHEASKQRKVLQPEELPQGEAAERLRELLLQRIADPDAHDPDGVWKLLIKTLPLRNPGEDPHLPLTLAIAWGLVPEHHNFWLDRADYDPSPEWPASYSDELEEIRKVAGKFEIVESACDELVSIDPESTRDWDDALCVKKSAAGGYLLSVALACPALGWPFGSELDKAVLRRATSLYLPEGEHFMMPEELALEVFSLKAGELRPALLVNLELDPEARLLSVSPEPVRVRVRANLTLPQCEAVLGRELATENGNPALPFADMLGLALELSDKLQRLRLESGAVITERPEIDITLKQDAAGAQVEIKKCPPMPLSQALVGELMIAATHGLALWAGEHDIPLIYRSQDVALPKDFSGVWRSEEDIARVLKALPPSILGLEPKPHAGIGHRFYSSFTAPMRRYTDLVNEAQVLGWLCEQKPAFSREELAALLPRVNSRMDVVGLSQRYRPRYWKLLYLQQQEQKAQRNKRLKYWDAVITDENNYYVNIMVDAVQLHLRGPRALFGERTMPGTRVNVRLGKINPLRNEIQIMEVLEG